MPREGPIGPEASRGLGNGDFQTLRHDLGDIIGNRLTRFESAFEVAANRVARISRASSSVSPQVQISGMAGTSTL